MKESRLIIWFSYLVGVVLVIPIVSYYLSLNDILANQSFIKIYLSGPGLVILGLLLFFVFRRKYIALSFFVIGLWWIISIVSELMNKIT